MLSGVSIICFAASYAVALALEVSRLWFRSGVRGAIMVGFAAAGLLAHSIYLYHRASHAVGAPLSSEQDWYMLAAWAMVVVYLYLVWFQSRTAFGLFLLPLVLGLIAAGVLLADPQPFARVPASKVWGAIHGGAIGLGAVAVLFGSAAGLMYLSQVRRLKLKRPPGRGLRLPSLEWLQLANVRATVVAVISLSIGVLSGMVLSAIRADGRLPLTDPVVLSTLLMLAWLIVALVLARVLRSHAAGRRVAYMTIVSLVFLVLALGAMLAMNTEHGGKRQAGPLEARANEPSARGDAR
jgi:ABC-type transport system involved in cytochrome c biogenesis permease subunit